MLGDEKPKNFVAKVSYNARNDIILVVVVFIVVVTSEATVTITTICRKIP